MLPLMIVSAPELSIIDETEKEVLRFENLNMDVILMERMKNQNYKKIKLMNLIILVKEIYWVTFYNLVAPITAVTLAI